MKMAAKGKFFKTVVIVEVISADNPPEFENLSELQNLITEGEHSGQYWTKTAKRITAKQAAKGLIKQGSDPEFLGLDKNGNDL
jgi:hypothetical protein